MAKLINLYNYYTNPHYDLTVFDKEFLKEYKSSGIERTENYYIISKDAVLEEV